METVVTVAVVTAEPDAGIIAVLLRDSFHRSIQLVHGLRVRVQNLSRIVDGLHVLEISILAERIGLEVVWEKRRRIVWGSGPTGEGAVGGVSFAVLVVGELVGEAAVGLGWREPVDGQAQRMQVHVAHSLKVKGVGIHEGPGRMAAREGQGSSMC